MGVPPTFFSRDLRTCFLVVLEELFRDCFCACFFLVVFFFSPIMFTSPTVHRFLCFLLPPFLLVVWLSVCDSLSRKIFFFGVPPRFFPNRCEHQLPMPINDTYLAVLQSLRDLPGSPIRPETISLPNFQFDVNQFRFSPMYTCICSSCASMWAVLFFVDFPPLIFFHVSDPL